MIGVFLHISHGGTGVASSDTVLQPLYFTLVLLVSSIPVLIFVKRSRTKGLFECAGEVSPVFARVLAFVIAAVFIYGTVRTVARFDLFSSSVMFPNENIFILLAAIVALSGYGAYLGLSSLGKSAVVISVFFVSASVFILLSLLDKTDIRNFTPLFENGTAEFLKEGAGYTSFAVETGLIPVLLPRISGKIYRGYFLWIASSLVTITAFAALTVASLGSFANTQMFPLFTLSALGEFAFIQRLDALETAAWILGVVLKTSFFINISVFSLRTAFPKISEKAGIIAVCAVVTGAVALISPNITNFLFFGESGGTLIVYALTVIVIPSLVLLTNRRLRNREKTH